MSLGSVLSEDRGRVVDMASEWRDVASLVESAVYAYRLPRWADQDNYVELWCEKQALTGILEPLASEAHVGLMTNKGYSSLSAMHDASKRFLRRSAEGKALYLLYLGDHDPSGEDMVRDVADRLAMFGVPDLQVEKVALTMDQIRQYNPPPNPAKMKDSRAQAYVAEHGYSSWEVDALPPAVLAQLIRATLAELTDAEAMVRVKAQEEAHKSRLRAAARQMAVEGGAVADAGVLHLRNPNKPLTLCGAVATLETTTDNGTLFADVDVGNAYNWHGPPDVCADCRVEFNAES